MNRQLQLAITAVSLGLACTLAAEPVYKSIDAQGKVVYSSTPPPEVVGEKVEEIEIAPGPTEQERKAAEQRNKELQDRLQNEEQQQEEKAQKAGETRSEAELELKNAKAALLDARVKHDDDWHLPPDFGRTLKPSYHERVEAAEKRVEEAEKAVRAAR